MTINVDHAPSTVLVVDDDMPMRMVTGDILVDAGFRVIEASDAQEALDLLEAGADVRAVVTDWVMPGEIDGVGLGYLVRERWPSVGTIVTSGKIHPADLPEGVRFLAKPYQPSALIEEVETAIQGSAEVPQGASIS